MGFNLLTDEIPTGGCTFKSMDENVATVDNSGVVTAKENGNTIIKIHNDRNNLDATVKINVNGSKNIVQPKIVGGGNHFVALKADGTVWTWGNNSNGQLGTGNNTSKTSPIKVMNIQCLWSIRYR